MAGLADKDIVIATHVYATGPAQDFRDYLKGRQVRRLLFIGHPLFYDGRMKGSGYELYQAGSKTEERYAPIRKLPALYSYLKALFLNIRWALRFGRKWDAFIGCNNLNALSGIFLKRLGATKKTIYYVIDYNPRRFDNRLLNFIYHKIDQFCVRHSDETWNLSDAMRAARIQYFSFSGGVQIEAPIGVWFDRIKRKQIDEIEKDRLVFLGHVIKKQGIQNVIAAMPEILSRIPRFRFLVIGGGDYIPALKEQAARLHVEDRIEFAGYVVDHSVIEEMLSRSGLAIAMYDRQDDSGNLSFTNFTDPGKLKTYLASGLFVLTTDVPPRARDIEKAGCGRILMNDPASIAQAVVGFMARRDVEELRAKAIGYARRYDWNLIFGQRVAGLWGAAAEASQ